jgi:RHS repeat-associated protein
VNSNTTTFTWDVNRSIPQVLDDEDLRYVYGLGRIAQVGASTHYYLSDGLGSTMALTDEAGDVVNDYDYDVFGALRDSSGSQDNDFTFAGEQVDEGSGLEYLRARYLDTLTGRFISRDQFDGWLAIPSSQNAYVYAGNNPASLIDPTGYEWIDADSWDIESRETEDSKIQNFMAHSGPFSCDWTLFGYDWVDCGTGPVGGPSLFEQPGPDFIPPVILRGKETKGPSNLRQLPSSVVKDAPGKSLENFKEHYVGKNASKYNVSYETGTNRVILTPVKPGSLRNIVTDYYKDDLLKEFQAGLWE